MELSSIPKEYIVKFSFELEIVYRENRAPIFAFPIKTTVIALVNNITSFVIPVAVDPDDKQEKVRVQMLFNNDETIPSFIMKEANILQITPSNIQIGIHKILFLLTDAE